MTNSVIDRLARERVSCAASQAGHVQQLKQIERLLRALHRVADAGFVPCGLRANLLDGAVVQVDVPSDALVDQLIAAGVTLAGRYESHRPACVWFYLDDVRVEWQVPREPAMPAPPAAPESLFGGGL